MYKAIVAFFVFLAFSFLYSVSSMAQTYGTWGAESTSNSILTGFATTPANCSQMSDQNYTDSLANSHGHPNYLGYPVGNACVITQPITMRYFYKKSIVVVPNRPSRCYLTFHKQQCLQ